MVSNSLAAVVDTTVFMTYEHTRRPSERSAHSEKLQATTDVPGAAR